MSQPQRPEQVSLPPGPAQPLSSGAPPLPTLGLEGEERDAADIAHTIWRNGAFEADTWNKAGDDAPIGGGPVIVSKKRWLADRQTLVARDAPLGLQLEPGESLDDIAFDLPHFALVALSFPKYSDGRAFSTARLLREKYGYTGELRAVGNVLNDQVAFMWRVGFDTLEVTHAPTRRALLDGRISQVKLYYQPSGIAEPPAGTRPWLRRANV